MIQVEGILATLNNNSINPAELICLSRDNPNVMKRVFKLLEEELKGSNNPRIVDAPCLLHPTHTAFKNAAKSLNMDVVSLLGNLHGWFKTSAARREDMVEVREELAEQLQDELEEHLDQFFLRHVDTRWLESQQCFQRLLDHFDSTVEYFTEYVSNSPLQNNKSAVKSKKYQKIIVHLCPDQVVQTKIRIKFLILLAETTKTFLTLLQSQKPMIHQLINLAFDVFKRLSNLVVKPAKRPNQPRKVKELDLSNPDNLLSTRECGFNSCCMEDVAKLGSNDRHDMRAEMKRAVVEMMKYLQANIPWENKFYTQLSFLDPVQRTDSDIPARGVAVAEYLKRFGEEQKVTLVVQLGQYQALPVDLVPEFKRQDQVDFWWGRIFGIITELNSVRPLELELLVKLTCTLAHGNAFLERGMGVTKRVVTGRTSLSDVSVKAQKMVKQMIDHYGGVTEVPITSEMMQYVREARSKYREALEKEKKEAAKSEKEKEETVQAAAKRKKEAESKKAWEEKKADLEQEIATSKEYISKQESSRRDATEKALKMTDPAQMKMLMMTAMFASEGAEKRAKILNEKQAELAKHMGKKRRQGD